MRFKQEPRPGGRGSRLWKVTLHELQHWTRAYSLPLPPELASPESNGTNGTDGTVRRVKKGPSDEGCCRNHPKSSQVGVEQGVFFTEPREKGLFTS